MKTVYIKKGYDFSPNSSVFVWVGTLKRKLNEFDYAEILIEDGQHIHAQQMWCRSKKIDFSELEDKRKYIVKPMPNKNVALIILALFSIDVLGYIFFKLDFFKYFVGLIGLYIFFWITIGSQRYLKIRPIGE